MVFFHCFHLVVANVSSTVASISRAIVIYFVFIFVVLLVSDRVVTMHDQVYEYQADRMSAEWAYGMNEIDASCH